MTNPMCWIKWRKAKKWTSSTGSWRCPPPGKQLSYSQRQLPGWGSSRSRGAAPTCCTALCQTSVSHTEWTFKLFIKMLIHLYTFVYLFHFVIFMYIYIHFKGALCSFGEKKLPTQSFNVNNINEVITQANDTRSIHFPHNWINKLFSWGESGPQNTVGRVRQI